ncbi:hypothetical protein EVAR_25731_1 [Eumeta japonica]|uniref:Uncharacterized protein n=1 Tax=Eumeta variegata TaxID=151549 RepID=A0A4C1V8W5_EUMVA|nr:hypothetical protein EVAR_25731_1 [Eumeta japonica]
MNMHEKGFVKGDKSKPKMRKRSNSEPVTLSPSEKRSKRISGDSDRCDLNQVTAGDQRADCDRSEDSILELADGLEPEHLGFLVCAHETLRFLHGRGVPDESPLIARLRSRFANQISEIGSV